MLLNLYEVLKVIKQVYHDNWGINIIAEREGKMK